MSTTLLARCVTGAPSATPTGDSRPEDAAVGDGAGRSREVVLQSKAGTFERAVGAGAPAANFPAELLRACHLVAMDKLQVAVTLRRPMSWLARANMLLAREYSLCRWVNDETLDDLRKGAGA